MLFRFKREGWGRRDHFVAIAGLGVLAALALTVMFFAKALQSPSLTIVFKFFLSTIVLFVTGAYVLRFRWARMGLMILCLAVPLAIVLASAFGVGHFNSGLFSLYGIKAVTAFTVFRAGYRNTRNKLAFEIEVDQSELEAFYRASVSNPWAEVGEALGLLGLALPIFAPLGLVVSLLSYWRMDEEAWPPIDGRNKAFN